MVYFEKEDILHLAISEEPESNSLELSPNITAELNADGELIGIEILNASTFIRDSILESAHAKMLEVLPFIQTTKSVKLRQVFLLKQDEKAAIDWLESVSEGNDV